MIINFDAISPSNSYHLLTQTIMPRPIAWVLSENEDASLNLAPFSFFNALCSEPPVLALSVGKKNDNELKDTGRNLLSGREFVIHIANAEQAEALNNSAAPLEYGESEVSADSLSLSDFAGCPIPRLTDCDIAYHCKLYDSHQLGANQQTIVYAQILRLHLNDEVVKQSNNRFIIDPDKINPLCRLGGTKYAVLKTSFSLTRP